MMPGTTGIPIDCGACGAHMMLDPSGDVAGAACSECGGTRFFRSQPSPVESEGTLRNMVDSDSQMDQGGNPLGEGTIMGNDGELPRGKRDNYMHSRVAYPQEPPMIYEGEPDIPPGMSMQDYRQLPRDQGGHHNDFRPGPRGGQDQCPICGGGFEHPLGFSQHLQEVHPGFGLNNGEFTVAKRVEPMRTLNMEPYPPLWDESYVKAAGFLAPLIPMAGEALGVGAEAGAGEMAGAAAKQFLPKALGPIMKGVFGVGGGQQNGGMAPEPPAPSPAQEIMSSVDIPFLLTADMDTPHSVKSVDEQHDDPEQQDQKQFHDGDKSPSNMENPNNLDSGASGEDGVRNHTEGYGFGPNSPGVDRAMMVLPLLLHYFQSEESGQSDPLVRALHDALEKESPGYMDHEDPESQQAVQMVLQHHSPHQAGVNAPYPQMCKNCGQGWVTNGRCGVCGAPAEPTAPQPQQPQHPRQGEPLSGLDMPAIMGGVNALPGMPTGGGGMGGSCPNCGGVLAGDGTCPQCGHKSGTQFGAQAPTGGGGGIAGIAMGGGASGGPSYPPNRVGRVATHVGPTTPEQIAAVQQALMDQGHQDLVPDVPIHPENYAHIMDQIQGNPNTAPLVDPSQQTPPPPQPGMMDPQGAMPVMDPSQMGGGGGQPMQPMAHVLGSYGWGQPQDPWHQFAYEKGIAQPQAAEKWFNWAKTMQSTAHTPPGQPGSLWPAPQGPDAFHQQRMEQAQQPPQPPQQPAQQPAQPMQPMAKRADANNAVPRCPKCTSASTSVHTLGDNTTDGTQLYYAKCHACDNTWKVTTSRVFLTDLINPALQNRTEHPDHDPGPDSSLTWKDVQGRPLMVGQTYSLRSPMMPIPDEIQVVAKKPDELGVKLVGDLSNVRSAGDDYTPDFTLTPQQVASSNYTFVPSTEADNTPDTSQPMGGMPGLEQIPQSGQTTDEATNSYPNRGTVSQVLASEPEDMVTDDLCHRCGGDWIDHVASSPTTMMHECARCGAVWESKDEYQGRESSADLSWLNESSHDDDFFGQMERARGMREASGQSRNLSSIAAQDERYQAVSQVLASNKMAREAGRHFTPGEQRALVNEKGTARNLSDLDLEGTHYLTRYDSSGKANELNVPEEHWILGL